MAVVILFLLLSCSAWLVHAQSDTPCPPVSGQSGCVCQHPDGIINLTRIANNDGTRTPRFRDLQDGNGFSYHYNPCYPYVDELCTNINLFICQFVTEDRTQSYEIAIGEQGIYTDSSGKVYLYYTGPGRETKVYLQCDQDAISPRAIAAGEPDHLAHYVFYVVSCAACPGGCRGGGGGGGGGIDRGVLIAISVVVAVSVVPCVIICVILFLILLVYGRSRKGHDITGSRQNLLKK